MKLTSQYLKLNFLLLISIICFSCFAQEETNPIRLFDSYEIMKTECPDTIQDGTLEGKYFMGNVIIVFKDSSFITPWGAVIRVSSTIASRSDMPVTQAITDAKGMFYIKNMQVGDFIVEVEYNNELVLTKYFSISDLRAIKLDTLKIPIENIEVQSRQREKYKKGF